MMCVRVPYSSINDSLLLLFLMLKPRDRQPAEATNDSLLLLMLLLSSINEHQTCTSFVNIWVYIVHTTCRKMEILPLDAMASTCILIYTFDFICTGPTSYKFPHPIKSGKHVIFRWLALDFFYFFIFFYLSHSYPHKTQEQYNIIKNRKKKRKCPISQKIIGKKKC
jgi:hypothetical protein